MIHYILGQAGSGKTNYCLRSFEFLTNAVFFTILRDENDENLVEKFKVIPLGEEISGKCVVDIAKLYRENIKAQEIFQTIMENAICQVLNFKNSAIFLDEFQLYCNDKIKDIILRASNDFYIIHQFPEQLNGKHFSPIWEKADKKYLLNPYLPSSFYKL